MSKDSKGGDNLANRLFAEAFLNKTEKHLEKAQDALLRGDEEQLNEHLETALDSMSNSFFNSSSPRLTEAENDERRRLLNLSFFKDESGLIGEHPVSKSIFNRLQFLDKKAIGE